MYSNLGSKQDIADSFGSSHASCIVVLAGSKILQTVLAVSVPHVQLSWQKQDIANRLDNCHASCSYLGRKQDIADSLGNSHASCSYLDRKQDIADSLGSSHVSCTVVLAGSKILQTVLAVAMHHV